MMKVRMWNRFYHSGVRIKPRSDDRRPNLLSRFVAAAIAADIVPMTGENRVLAYFGLQVINSDPRPGIKALVHQAKKNKP
jgi:single-stranded DNA-specific DHH superfamily exonuclease